MNRAHSCSVYKKCGGCQLTNMTYEEQLSHKMKYLIAKLGKLCRVDEIIGMDVPLHYRNKMQAAFSGDGRGHVISGVWQSSTHKVVKTDNCLIEDESSLWIVRAARNMLREYKISVYNNKTEKGTLRHIMVRRAHQTGETMVVIVTNGAKFPRGKEFAEELVRRFPQIHTVVHYVNNTETPLWLEKQQEVLYGEGYIEDILCGKKFKISAKSFYQVNSVQTEVLYGKAVEFADLTGKENVIDAYCGIGTIGIIASDKAEQVIGIETEPASVKNAAENAKLNDVSNYKVIGGDAGKIMTKLVAEGKRPNVVFADPPRSGCTKEFLNSLIKCSPEKIVYVSCNPDTLARDAAYLVRNGYRVNKIQPVDLFPHTNHVEVVSCLTRIKNEKYTNKGYNKN